MVPCLNGPPLFVSRNVRHMGHQYGSLYLSMGQMLTPIIISIRPHILVFGIKH